MFIDNSVWDHGVTGSELLVLLCLASFANTERECWPGLPTIQSRTNLSQPTIYRALSALKGKGIIEQVRRRGYARVWKINQPEKSFDHSEKTSDQIENKKYLRTTKNSKTLTGLTPEGVDDMNVVGSFGNLPGEDLPGAKARAKVWNGNTLARYWAAEAAVHYAGQGGIVPNFGALAKAFKVRLDAGVEGKVLVSSIDLFMSDNRYVHGTDLPVWRVYLAKLDTLVNKVIRLSDDRAVSIGNVDYY